jgi:hypothetical protein
MKETPLWDVVKSDPNYQNLKTNDAIASEVLSRLSEERNTERLFDEAKNVLKEHDNEYDVTLKNTVISRVKNAIKTFWLEIGKLVFGKTFKTQEEVLDKVLYDLLDAKKMKVKSFNSAREYSIVYDADKKRREQYRGMSKDEIAEAQSKKMQEIADALNKAFPSDYPYKVESSVTDYGVSTYAKKAFGGKVIRLSDHATGIRRSDNEVNIFQDTDPNIVVDSVKASYNARRSEHEQRMKERAEASKFHDDMRNKWNTMSDKFSGMKFRSTPNSTYANLDEFMKKHPSAKYVRQIPDRRGGKNKYGEWNRYNYEWFESGHSDKAPSDEYVKWIDSLKADDVRFRVMNTPERGLHGATRAEVETAGRRTAEKLGGSETEFINSSEAPEEVRTKIESGKNAKGWYDPNTGKVYVLKDKATSKEDVQHTIFHEKLGHEGLSVLLGGQEAVNKFGNFIYLSADANLRDLINKKAKELGKSALDKDGMSIAAQEVFADIAENGPRSAEEFNLWRKVKYYLIQAAKKMGITFHGMLNDDDMRYYILKTGEALKHWDKMDATMKEDIQYPNMYRETYTDDKGNKHDMPPKPRKKKNESFMNFKNRMEEWERKSEALKDVDDPIPAEFNMDTDEDAQKEWADIMDSWKSRHGLTGEQPENIPDRVIGQSDEDYLSSIKNYEKWSEAAKDKDDPMPDMFDFLGKKQDEYYKRYYDWKARHQIADEMNTDLAIYGNATEKYLDKGGVIDEQYHLLEDEKTPEEKDLTEKVNEDIIHEIGDSLGVDTSPEGVKKIVKYSVIDRRKDLESMNAENAIEIHNIDKDITEVAKQMGIKPEDLSKALILDLEHDRRLSDIAKSLNSSLTFILGHIRPLTKEDIEAVEPLLRELAELDKNRDEADPIPEEVETKAAQIATKLNSLSTKLPEREMEKARKRAEAKHDRVLAGISQLLNETQTFVQNHLTITPADLLHVESKLEKLRSMVAGIGDGIRTAPMNDLASEIARAINDLHKGDKGFVPISGEELMDVLPVLTRNTKVPM